MSTNPLKKLSEFKQSIWPDFIRRDLLVSGEMEQLITEDKVKGVTSNPAIFKEAFDSGDIYQSAIRLKRPQNLPQICIPRYNPLSPTDSCVT